MVNLGPFFVLLDHYNKAKVNQLFSNFLVVVLL